ncbi:MULTISPECIES: hypothetical protein [Clostridium]|nr:MULTISPECIES: hypothetical protein [Clostridium]
MLAYNEKNSTVEKYLKTSNIVIGKFTCVKTNMKLNYNIVKNT